MSKQFRRFSELPGFHYETRPTGLFRLPCCDELSQRRGYELGAKRQAPLSWRTVDGSPPSASPGQKWKPEPMPGESAGEAALRQLHEGLEQPGWPRHYHFAIHYCNEALWKSRREDPWAIEQMELLCWLDIQLIEAYPDAISFESDAETQYANVDAFYRLIKLYENDGYLHEALDVARRAVGFKQAQNYFASLQERIRQLETEDAH